jgi:7-cyano-7-deazaguanine synthase
MIENTKAIVLFSGGQDSTICLAHALDSYEHVETIGFNYGQRHSVELACRQDVRREIVAAFSAWGARLGEDHTIDAGVIAALGETAMTADVEITMTAAGLPSTFVPGRNLMFLTLAGALAYRRGITVLIGGMCETDYSGYPDCRAETLMAQQQTLSLGLDASIKIVTPLMYLDKCATWALGEDLGGQTLTDIVVEHTHTCYLGDRTHRHAWGYGCGDCPACELRARGWQQWTAAA